MHSSRELARAFLILGGIFVALGLFFYFDGRLPFRLGRLPGDIVHQGQHGTFYFPIATCLLLSVALSLLFWLVRHFHR